MKDKFYELSIKSSNFYDEILELVFSFGITCVEERENEIIIRDEDDLSQIQWGIEQYVSKLCDTLNIKNDLQISLNLKENKDWINEYKSGVKPVLLGEFYIRPSWEEAKENAKNIIIDPALAFGSGHHESTSSCIMFLQKYAKDEMKAMDVGCGSGILSIALTKIGCIVDACDTDELAVQSTLQNAKLNNADINKIWTGSISNLNTKYNIVVANIIADVIFMLKNDLKNILENNAYLILSGILQKYEDRILQNFADLKLIEKKQLNDWVSFVFQK
ncbi:50S ribosomal protein L11 methyltransferase [Campylobacter sp. RM12920]|uniref:Ribosomal protein L11 methyltransferase n=1 Tax=Campylobacter californiensis TaxID=1032243 RepID=A0ABD4JJB9_9BACT|nr:50S ribosomal protein L11 methyltransferase [Campylobacter sp. RM12919]MBE2988572.1 50S ribosomal protein L11 methyltransferase [Campylobacter sp. RM12920]